MSLRSFLKLVEIQTKVASVIPFLLGSVYALYHFHAFSVKNFCLMFVSLLCIDMATTAINNYIDYKSANRKHGYGYESHNAIVRDRLNESAVLLVIITLLLAASVLGYLLFINTNFVVLLLGGLSFLVGIFYSFGPVPISRTPFGELLSGGFQGLVLPFLAVYIHQSNLLTLIYQNGLFQVNVDIKEVFFLFLVFLPAALGIANIMLANNICDMEDDFENKRYTLPLYIGKKAALKVFQITYYIAFAAILIAVAFGALPLLSLLTLITILIVYKHIRLFISLQTKKDTFVTSVKNFVLMNTALLLTTGAQVLINTIFQFASI